MERGERGREMIQRKEQTYSQKEVERQEEKWGWERKNREIEVKYLKVFGSEHDKKSVVTATSESLYKASAKGQTYLMTIDYVQICNKCPNF